MRMLCGVAASLFVHVRVCAPLQLSPTSLDEITLAVVIDKVRRASIVDGEDVAGDAGDAFSLEAFLAALEEEKAANAAFFGDDVVRVREGAARCRAVGPSHPSHPSHTSHPSHSSHPSHPHPLPHTRTPRTSQRFLGLACWLRAWSFRRRPALWTSQPRCTRCTTIPTP